MSRFVHEVPMRWSDMDAYRHVNNSAYFAYLEQARVAMFFADGSGFSAGTVIARHEIDYLRPVVYHPDPLRIELWVEQIGAARFTIGYELFDGALMAARALTCCVTYDFDAAAPRRLTVGERVLLKTFADRPADGSADRPADGSGDDVLVGGSAGAVR